MISILAHASGGELVVKPLEHARAKVDRVRFDVFRQLFLGVREGR